MRGVQQYYFVVQESEFDHQSQFLTQSFVSAQAVDLSRQFVNASLEEINGKIKKYDLDLIQLHGEETPEFCENLKQDKIF